MRLALLILALIAPSASGCDARGEPPAGRTVTLWTWALRPAFDGYMIDLIADFEAQNPGVRVEWTDVPAGAMRRKMFAAGAADRLPDVVNLSDRDFAAFASLGALRPLDSSLLPGDADGRYVAGAMAACRIDGELMALPWYLSTPVRLANADLLAEGGLTPEAVGGTWSELLEQAMPFREATGKYLLTLRLGAESDLTSMLASEGLATVVRRGGRWHSNLGDPAVAAYVGAWVDLYRAGGLPRGAATEGYAQMVRNYADNWAAVIDANALRAVSAQGPAAYAATRVLPGVVGATGRAGVAVTAVGVSSQADEPELAARLAWHMTGPAWQERLAREASRVPATADSLGRVDSFLPIDGDPKTAAATRLSADQIAAGAEPRQPAIGPWPDLKRIFDDVVTAMLLADAEPDVAAQLAEASAEWDRILAADAAGLPWK